MKVTFITALCSAVLLGCSDPTSLGHPCDYVLLLPKPSDSVTVALNGSASLSVTSEWPNGCAVRSVDWATDAPAVARLQGASDTTAMALGQSTGTAHITAQLRGFASISRVFTVVVTPSP
jgi:hypothetical protein